LFILPADKDNAKVTMNIKDYHGKKKQLPNDSTLKAFQKDPTNKIHRITAELIKKADTA
jgi:hypothetical protein